MLEPSSPSKIFHGVTFVLVGFDPETQRRIRAKLVSSGGVDAGRYGPNCTHVVVGRIVYDDTLCVAARDDGKVVVTGLWVDHSYDVGMPVDTSSIIYRPVRDLNGIPGAKSLVMCLTGYQGPDREDIMTMVSLMGAQFSKPLVANKVTHLICYKFEGEKYELAKMMQTIKLVNHRWLEDCLRDWEILPEVNYSKSTYELEMMEAEAKDSEEEDDKNFLEQPRENAIKRSPFNQKVGIGTSLLPTRTGESSKRLSYNGAVQNPSNVPCLELKSKPAKETRESLGIDNINSQQILGGPDMDHQIASASTILHEASERTCPPANLLKEATASKTPEDSQINAKSCSLSYSRKGPRRTSPGKQDGVAVGEGNSSKMQIQTGEVDGSFGKSPTRLEHLHGVIASDNVQFPSTIGDVSVRGSNHKSPKKRKLKSASAHSKSRKINLHTSPSTSGSPIMSNRTPECKASALMDQPLLATTSNSCLDKEEICLNKVIDWDAAGKDVPSASALTSQSSGEKQGVSDLLSKAVSSGINGNKSTAPPLSETASVVGKPDTPAAAQIDEVMEDRIKQQDLAALSLRRREEDIATFPKQVNVDILDRGRDKVDQNQAREMVVSRKKTLGSRPKLSKSANIKGSICLSKDASVKDPVNSPLGREVMSVPDKPSNINDNEASLSHGDIEALDTMRNTVVAQSRDRAQETEVCVDDETEAPDEGDNVIEKRNNGEKSEGFEMAASADADKEDESAHGAPNISNPGVVDDFRKADDGGKSERAQLICKGRNVVGKASRGRKPSLVNKKQKATSAAKERIDDDGSEMEAQKRPESHGKAKSASKLEVSPEAEKENEVVANADRSVNQCKGQAQKSSLNSEKIAMKMNVEAGERNATSIGVMDRRIEPAWFILSGHSQRQHRKQFQQIIRRLRGRFCRDSKQWSYQATHFIVPDPIRRTEKFFAAAASGRWILRTDYLDASNQAGKFLDEEPYEWYRNGLSEDGTINLEAPRKWRLLRERTGHGAFYDMRIVIYGECIAPSLDTLKRVVKAGGGTILATSPPYNRFFSKGVDFAVVSPGITRADIWVQEFLRQEIPCIVADYLVDYVCKPGYPLEKYVLYNTHSWAEKSFSRLQKKAEETLAPVPSDDNGGGGDLSCAVCGSADRGDVMLICGDESGSAGCGIGAHIDCCDPPLEAVPEDDWFCPSCREGRSSSSSSAMKRKRGGSVLRSNN